MTSKPSEFINRLRMLHISLLGGMMVFATIIFVLVSSGKFPAVVDASIDRILQVVALILTSVLLVVGFGVFKKRIRQVHQSTDPALQKLDKYRTSCITWWAMIEAPGIFALVGFLLTGNYAFFALACFHILLLTVFMPRKDNIIVLINLNSDELGRLEK